MYFYRIDKMVFNKANNEFDKKIGKKYFSDYETARRYIEKFCKCTIVSNNEYHNCFYTWWEPTLKNHESFSERRYYCYRIKFDEISPYEL